MALLDITLNDVFAARARVQGHVWHTPLERSAWLSAAAGTEVYLKLECFQRTGSFKVRGAFNAVASLPESERARGLITASAGNHGQAVSLAASRFGARATIFVPRSAPEAKKSRIRSFGATLDDHFESYDDAEDAAVRWASEHQSTFVHAFSDAAVVAGQGTLALELLEDLPAVRTVVIPVGGGGLIAGMGTVLKAAGARVLGVQSDRTPNVHAALAAGRLVDCPVVATLADGLAGRTDEISVQRVSRIADDVRLVPEAALAPAIRDLFRHEGVVAEGAGIVGVAALLAQVLTVEGPVVLVISGRNLDSDTFARILGDT
jgi:threonine dehydratase